MLLWLPISFSSCKKRLPFLKMNVSFNNVGSFRIEIEETACFYFCNHFYKVFNCKVKVRGASVLKQSSSREVIGYCSDCQKN